MNIYVKQSNTTLKDVNTHRATLFVPTFINNFTFDVTQQKHSISGTQI
jgi:hypothetical protein